MQTQVNASAVEELQKAIESVRTASLQLRPLVAFSASEGNADAAWTALGDLVASIHALKAETKDAADFLESRISPRCPDCGRFTCAAPDGC